MALLCLDIGNTTGHMGLLEGFEVLRRWDVPTRKLVAADSEARAALEAVKDCEGLCYSSVVPAASAGVDALLAGIAPRARIHHLRWDAAPGLGFDYPNPAEVGEDRMANAIGAQVVCGAPAVVVDMGTATTFDVLTSRGYAGGIIAPGLALMAEYLHEKTALLPRLDRLDLATPGAVGKSTADAMRIGANLGFRGMIREMLRAVLDELRACGEGQASVLTTGGNAIVLPEGWWPGARHLPDLTLYGLAEAFRRAGNER